MKAIIENRILTLDGWRGVAILLVLVYHSEAFIPFRDDFALGFLGVDLFFVISGYIITRLLLAESEHEHVLRRFYLRRAFRILPPVCVYLATLSLISLAIPIVAPSEVAGSLLFFRNYQIALSPHSAAMRGGEFTMHFWSLAVEEHFYMLWPTLLVVAGKKRAAIIAATGAVACALWRQYDSPTSFVSTHFFPLAGGNGFFRVIRTDERLDGLFVGCILAIALTNGRLTALLQRNFPKETPILCAFPILLLAKLGGGYPRLSIYSLMAIAIGSTLVIKEGLAFRLLNFRPLVWIGQISYALYIWQQLFMQKIFNLANSCLSHPFNLGPRLSLAMTVVFSLLVATISTYWLERPMIELGKRKIRKKAEVTVA